MNLQSAPKDSPYPLFNSWYAAAKLDHPDYFNGMNLTTVNSDGYPASRIVLLKEHNEQGFVFYTNYRSRKGREIEQNAKVAANFWWSQAQRQIRIEGEIETVSAEQSDRYFLSRPKGSQLAAIASLQSEPIGSFHQLEEKYADVVERHKDKAIQRPLHWGGYRIKPQSIEFWQGLTHRLHHRLVYKLSDGQWNTEILQP